MSDVTKPSSTGEHPVTQGELRTQLKWSDLKIVGGVVVAIFVAGWVSSQVMFSWSADAATREIAPLTARVAAAEQRLDIHIQESREAHASQARSQERLEVKIDAMLTSQRTGKPPPPIDGGEHD